MVNVNDVFLVVGMIAGVSVAAFIIWNSSKKIATLEFQLKNQHDKFDQDIRELKETRHELIVQYNDRLTMNVKELTEKISDAKVERRDDIQKAVDSDKEALNTIQKQLDAAKSDIKDVAARVIIVNTKIEHVEKDIVGLRECDAEVKKFFADWNQRIEDRVEQVREEFGKFRQEFVTLFSSFHAPFHTPFVDKKE